MTPSVSQPYKVGPEELPVLGCIKLLTTIIGTGSGGESQFTSLMFEWLVVDVPSAYNTIIKRSTHTAVRMRTNVKYLTLLFETEDGDVLIYIDQKEARSVMAIALRTTAPKALKDQDENNIETKKAQLAEDRTTRVTRNLPEDTKVKLVNLLQINK